MRRSRTPTPDDQPTPPPIELEDVHVTRGEFHLHVPHAHLPRGQVTAIVGPNGSGKSTLLKLQSRLLEPHGGTVLVDGRDVTTLSPKEVARRVGVLPQSPDVPEGTTVEELVEHGRYPHRGLLSPLCEEDEDAMAWALDATNLTNLRHRRVDTLSGGERQRAWIAMALAQRTSTLLLDEPTTYLDVRYQIEVLELVRRLNRTHGLTVGLVLHDLNQAAAYSDRMLVMDDGRIVERGPPRQVLTEELLHRVFGIDAEIVHRPGADAPAFIPRGLASEATPSTSNPLPNDTETAPCPPDATTRT